MVAAQSVDSLELRRRITGLKFTEISTLTGIPYKRLWRFFRDDGPLTRNEMARVEAALTETTDSPNSLERRDSPDVTEAPPVPTSGKDG